MWYLDKCEYPGELTYWKYQVGMSAFQQKKLVEKVRKVAQISRVNYLKCNWVLY